jgi:two-component system response regulator AlgR
MEALHHGALDLILLDIHMPGVDGLTLARTLNALSEPPAIIFVTAHAEHAVQAFELEAVDYLTKPVRLERLEAALLKVQRLHGLRGSVGAADSPDDVLVIQDRGRTERVPLSEILFFKAELKYITVRTEHHSYSLDASLGELEARFGHEFLRIHRNALVARRAIRALEKHHDPLEGDCWAVRLSAVAELLTVSRRQLAAVRDSLSH